MRTTISNRIIPASAALVALFAILLIAATPAMAQTATFHFEDICRSDPAVNKDTVTVFLHDDFHYPLADVTINALWS